MDAEADLLRVASLSDAQAVVAQDPLHQKGVRVGHVSPWHRKKDWSVLPEQRDLPAGAVSASFYILLCPRRSRFATPMMTSMITQTTVKNVVT